MIRHRRVLGIGFSLGNSVLVGLVLLIMGLGFYAVSRSMDAQRQVASAFVGWYENSEGYKQALADQKVTRKPILLYFYATWCPHCKKFSADVLSSRKMRDFVTHYPHVRIEPDHGPAERKLMDDFKAPGYPSFYVITADQRRIDIGTHTRDSDANLEARMKKPAEFIRSILEATGGQ